jgi:hypothetical protein
VIRQLEEQVTAASAQQREWEQKAAEADSDARRQLTEEVSPLTSLSASR